MIPATITRAVGLTAAAAVAAAVTVLPAAAWGAAGTSALKLDGPAAQTLRAQGVKVVPVAPARGSARRVVLPIGAGLAGAKTTLLRHRGAIELRRSDRKLRITGLSLLLSKRARMEARIGGGTADLFRVLSGGEREIDTVGGSVALRGLRLKLSGAAAREIVERLELGGGRAAARRLAARPFGGLSGRASGLTGTGAPPASGDGAVQQSTSCPLPGTAGPAPEEPLPVKARPAAALDITTATIDWHVRESFVRYIDSGEGTSVTAGASADPPVVLPGSSAALSYVFHFPFSSGWLDLGADPASATDDTGLLGFSGAVRFLYSAHEIDLTTADPEIEIAGGASRAIFTVSESGGAPGRQVLINLDLSRAAAISASGNSYVYERVPGAIPSGTASSTFAGFYAPGTEFGCVTVRFSTG